MARRWADHELAWGGARQLGVTDWPCLDLANCVPWRLHDPANALATYGDVARWARHERLLDDREAAASSTWPANARAGRRPHTGGLSPSRRRSGPFSRPWPRGWRHRRRPGQAAG